MLGFLGLLFQASAAAACPDLTGRYTVTGEDGSVSVIIAQTACTHIAIEWNIHTYAGASLSPHRLRIDGRPQPDSGWFGSSHVQLTSAAFVGDTLILTGTPPPGSDDHPTVPRAVFWRVPDGVCAAFQERSGRSPVVFGRRVLPGQQATGDSEDHMRCSAGRMSPSNAAAHGHRVRW